MSFFDSIGGLLNQYIGGNAAASTEEAHQHYDQVTSAVPSGVLGSAIGPALSSLAVEEIQQHIFNSASQMSPAQRGGFVQSIMGGLASSGGNVSSILSQLGISPSVADNPQDASPEDVAALAAHTQQNSPDVFHRAMEFYAEHPTLVKAMGAAAVSAIIYEIARR
jgi:hypothetical protein